MRYAILCLATFVAGCVGEPFGECPPVDGKDPVYLPDTTARHVFWECSSGSPVKLVCPKDLVHDPNLNVCVYPSAESKPFGPIGKCEYPTSKKLLRDGLNVAVYWACTNGEPVMHRCKNNMWFLPDFGGACYVPEHGHPVQ